MLVVAAVDKLELQAVVAEELVEERLEEEDQAEEMLQLT
jgi:hypothetical protein